MGFPKPTECIKLPMGHSRKVLPTLPNSANVSDSLSLRCGTRRRGKYSTLSCLSPHVARVNFRATWHRHRAVKTRAIGATAGPVCDAMQAHLNYFPVHSRSLPSHIRSDREPSWWTFGNCQIQARSERNFAPGRFQKQGMGVSILFASLHPWLKQNL